MERTAWKNKVEIISWGSLLRNSRESEESLYFDDTHASDRGAIIVWQESVKKLREKGEIIRKIEQAYKPIKIAKNMCLRCGKHGHYRSDCSDRNLKCEKLFQRYWHFSLKKNS